MNCAQQLRFGPFRFDPANQCLWHGAQAVELAPKAFAVLSYLIAHPGRLVTKEELLQAVWPDVYVTDAVLKVRVGEIRKALNKQVHTPHFIQTLHGRGYRFIAEVVPVQDVGDGSSTQTRQAQSESSLVGRHQVIAQLHEHLRRAQQGNRQLVFVTGEAGMGKTAVVDTFVAQVNAQPQVLTATGQCIEHYGAGEAFLPVLEALSRLCRQPGAEHLPAALRRYSPTWLAQLPWLIEESEQTPLQHEILGTTHARMLREMGELCEALTRQAPFLLLLEDLHWCDYATLDLLSFLAQQREPARLLVIGTFRPVQLILRDHPLKAVKQELELHRQCKELTLDFLTATEVDEFLQYRFPGHALPAWFAGVVHRRTDGNPLFLTNVIHYLLRRGMLEEHDNRWHLSVALAEVKDLLPESLQLMVNKQLDRLAVEQQQVLSSASIAGAEFTAAAVAAGLTWDITKVDEYCEKLAQTGQFLRARGVVELPDGTQSERYAFIHNLYQDVLWRRLTIIQRAQLHYAIGMQKESAYASGANGIAAELALHFEHGRDFPRAIDYLRRAASNAIIRYSNRAALGYETRALQLLDRLPAAEQPSLRLQLLKECGHIRRAMADMHGAAADFSRLLACARQQRLIDWEISTSLDLASVLSWIDREQCLAVVAEIQSRCDSMENELLRAYARGWCAYWNLLWRRWSDEDAEACAAAVAAARRSGQREQLSSLLGRLSYFQSLRSDYRSAGETAAEGLRHALETGDAADYQLTLFFRSWALLHSGEWGTLYRLLHDDGLPMAEKSEHHLWVLLFQLQSASLAEQAFSFETAHDLSQQALQQAQRSDLPYGRLLGSIRLGFAQLGLGRLQQAFDSFNTGANWLAGERVLMDWVLKMPLHHGLSRYWFSRGEYRRAGEQASTVCRLAAVPGERTFMALGHNTLAEIAVAENDRQQARTEVELALALLDGVEAPLAQWRVYATAAELADSQANHSAAAEYWQRSASTLSRLAGTLGPAPALRQSLLEAAPVRAVLGHQTTG